MNKVKEFGTGIDYSDSVRRLRVDCSELACTQIHCEIPGLENKEKVLVKINSRLWVNTLIQGSISLSLHLSTCQPRRTSSADAFYDASISSVGIAKVTELPFDTPDSLTLPVKVSGTSRMGLLGGVREVWMADGGGDDDGEPEGHRQRPPLHPLLAHPHRHPCRHHRPHPPHPSPLEGRQPFPPLS